MRSRSPPVRKRLRQLIDIPPAGQYARVFVLTSQRPFEVVKSTAHDWIARNPRARLFERCFLQPVSSEFVSHDPRARFFARSEPNRQVMPYVPRV